MTWTFLTNHARVLGYIANDPKARLREIAAEVGITERAVYAIVDDLSQAGYLTKRREGNRNHYEVHMDRPLRHPYDSEGVVGDVVRAVRRRSRSPHSKRGHLAEATPD